MIVSSPAAAASEKKISYLKDLDYSVVQQCMHCGMCLPVCPTYQETKQEKNSPRGRIALMRSIADGDLITSKEFGKEMYYCLGCLACTTACPAGVDYAQLFENARAEVETQKVLDKPARNIIRQFTLGWMFMDLRRLELLGFLIRFYNKSGIRKVIQTSGILNLLPKNLRDMEAMTPPVQDKLTAQLVPPHAMATGSNRSGKSYRVAMLSGCAQDLIFSDVNVDTVTVLQENGCEVIIPEVQNCCGSLHAHNGEYELAQELARRNIDQFPPENFDAIISNAGGCGSHLKHYSHFLHDDPVYAEKAKLWDAKIKDIHEWLVEIDFRHPSVSPFGHGLDTSINERVTYHHSCHLSHGQGVTSQPNAILSAIPGIDLVELNESQWCCGSAGVYNITQPEMAQKLLDRKMGHINDTCANTVCTGNPGCQLQIQNGVKQQKLSMDVNHTVSLLARAYRADSMQ